ncbi:MAG: hypothetical protein ABSG36_09990 [Acidimicrobiales bacterium]|jgi:hypothetical protein
MNCRRETPTSQEAAAALDALFVDDEEDDAAGAAGALSGPVPLVAGLLGSVLKLPAEASDAVLEAAAAGLTLEWPWRLSFR